MELNLAQLKDLELICVMATQSLLPAYGLPKEQMWLERIAAYQKLFRAEIDRLEGVPPDEQYRSYL